MVAVYEEGLELEGKENKVMTDVPFSGGNLPPFWMKFLKEEGALLKEPSFSSFMTSMFDWPETSRDIFRVCWYLEGAKKAWGGVKPGRVDALFAPWLEMLINPDVLATLAEATIPLSD